MEEINHEKNSIIGLVTLLVIGGFSNSSWADVGNLTCIPGSCNDTTKGDSCYLIDSSRITEIGIIAIPGRCSNDKDANGNYVCQIPNRPGEDIFQNEPVKEPVKEINKGPLMPPPINQPPR